MVEVEAVLSPLWLQDRHRKLLCFPSLFPLSASSVDMQTMEGAWSQESRLRYTPGAYITPSKVPHTSHH